MKEAKQALEAFDLIAHCQNCKHRLRTVLVAPLNWGLGHATRCIPIIKTLLELNCKVILASDGRAFQLLEQEFPNLTLIELPTYNIQYGRKSFTLTIALQLPKIAWAIVSEYFSIRKIVAKHQVDLIISDNRYGCFHRTVSSIFMTHQINLLVPNPLLQSVSRWLNRFFITTFFQTCWIPDVAGEPNLSGDLSHNTKLKKIEYVGVLSRMKPQATARKYDFIAVLSGPEPQRTHLETKIIEQLKVLSYKGLIVAGKPENIENYALSDQLEYCSFMGSEELNLAMEAAEMVICRSGYSTLMDLAQLQKKALLIPTPGQTEQEYLAQRCLEAGLYNSQKQADLTLAEGIKKTLQQPNLIEQLGQENKLEGILREVLARIG